MKHIVYQNLTTNDLKPGQVVVLRNGQIRMVAEIGVRGSLILFTAQGIWDYLSKWNPNLTAEKHFNGRPASDSEMVMLRGLDVMEVYGVVNDVSWYGDAFEISTENRPLLWSRNPVKRMTVAEIEKKLGYKIEIVSEEG